MDAEQWIQEAQKAIAMYGVNVLFAAAIFVVGKWIARKISDVIEKLMTRAKVEPTLVKFMGNLCYAGLLAFVVIASLARLGIQTASFIAVLGAAGFAVGMALQGSLSNFAAGVLILLFRPFKVGDVVTLSGITGRVEEIQIFNTLLCSGDNIRHFIPNSHATGGPITNITAHPTRRIDMVFGVSYSDDLKKVRQIIQNVLTADTGVLKEPVPVVAVAELADSSVNFYVRPWAKTAEYWDVRFRLIEKIKEEFDRNGITIPFPQRQLHMAAAPAGQ